MALADRDRGQVDAVGDVADGVDRLDARAGVAVDEDAPVRAELHARGLEVGHEEPDLVRDLFDGVLSILDP